MKNENLKTLLILGNGFDLTLDMHSTFKEFGIFRRNKLKGVPISEWTLIDLLLEVDTHGNWGKRNEYYKFNWWDFEKYLKMAVLRTIYSRDFLNIVSHGLNDEKERTSEDITSQLKREIDLVTTLSRDDFLFQDELYPNITGLLVDNNKLSEIDESNVDHQHDGYFWQLFFLKRVTNYLKKVNANLSIESDVLFVDDINAYKKQRIKEENLTSSESKSKITGLFRSFYEIEPVLVHDLEIWEKAFSEFIKLRQGKASPSGLSYEDASGKFIKYITGDITAKQDVQILNFNYSKPTIPTQANASYSEQLNIHGSTELEKDVTDSISGIIIGYDYKALLDSPKTADLMAPFTKTFRISQLNTILAKHRTGRQSMKLNYKVDRIVIVGHSLSAADDSYFRTIFDSADLYDSEVVLEYWYTNYPGRDKSVSIETENLMMVNKLLIRYIQTSKQINKDNLLHKLLLENRLVLREYCLTEILS